MQRFLTAGGAALMLCLAGCSLFQGAPKVSLPGVTAQAPKDAGTPATIAQTSAGASIALAAGSVVTVTKLEAIPATKDAPAQPAKEITVIQPSAPTEYHQTESKTQASTGTISTALGEKRIEAEESRPLLYAAIGAALLAGFFIYRAYPTPALCCGGASIVFFMAWRLAGLPPWFWAIGLAAIVGGGALWVGHERGLYTPVPDDKKTP